MCRSNPRTPSTAPTAKRRLFSGLLEPGTVLVILGVVAVVVVALVALFKVDDTDGAKVAAAGIGAVGTLVGVFFGHHVGSKGKATAESDRREESLKVEELLMQEPKDARMALETARARHLQAEGDRVARGC